MKIENYFKNNRGTGILSTADSSGQVNSAVYASPHILDDEYVTFITHDKRTRQNLLQNQSASYLFIENGEGFHGIRMTLEKVNERQDPELINKLSRRAVYADVKEAPTRYLISFKVNRVSPLLGDKEIDVQIH